MASTLVIQIQSNRSQAQVKQDLQSAKEQPREILSNFLKEVRRIQGRSSRAKLFFHTSAAAPVAASGSATCASVADADTIVIGGVTLTAKTSPSGQAQWARGVDDTTDAAALKACINAHSTLSQILVATSALGVVTITALERGVIGNFVIMSQTGSHITLAQLAGGTGGSTEAAVTVAAGL